jgi:hypothetical protein
VAAVAEQQRLDDRLSTRGFQGNIRTSGLGDEDEVPVKRIVLGV